MPEASPEGSLDAAGVYRAPAVLHAVRLLEAFVDGPADYGISELSRQAGLSKSTVHRLVTTLVEVGWLERNPTTDKDRLGVEVVELGSAGAARPEGGGCALPVVPEPVRRGGG